MNFLDYWMALNSKAMSAILSYKQLPLQKMCNPIYIVLQNNITLLVNVFAQCDAAHTEWNYFLYLMYFLCQKKLFKNGYKILFLQV